MVAYAGPYCVPYFTGDDAPCFNTGTTCDPSTVWCDMAAIIDAKFTEFDAALARSATSFPYAQVAVTALPITLTNGSGTSGEALVTWDAVLGDSDNMVDLSADPNTVFLRRSGIWELSVIEINTSNTNDVQCSYRVLAPAITPAIFNPARRTWVDPVAGLGTLFATPIGLAVNYSQFVLVNASAGPVPIQGQLEVFASGGGVILTYNDIRFAARWVADTP